MGIQKEGKRFLLSSEGSSYLLEISGDGLPVNLHWGGKIGAISELADPDSVRNFLLHIEL